MTQVIQKMKYLLYFLTFSFVYNRKKNSHSAEYRDLLLVSPQTLLYQLVAYLLQRHKPVKVQRFNAVLYLNPSTFVQTKVAVSGWKLPYCVLPNKLPH